MSPEDEDRLRAAMRLLVLLLGVGIAVWVVGLVLAEDLFSERPALAALGLLGAAGLLALCGYAAVKGGRRSGT